MKNNVMFRGNPIKHCSEDLLDRSGISHNISKLICDDELNECCTIGISGPWGCGKTSIINMIRENVEKNQNNVLFIDFSPINYQSSTEDITKIFFDVLITNLKKHKCPFNILGYKRNVKKISNKTIETAVRIIFNPADVNSIISNIKQLSGAIFNPVKYDPIETIRENVSALLSKSKIKLAIIIDDLDRLMPDEVIQILKLIRTTACFDNVYYILGYDETTLSKQINGYTGQDGSKYLEKFIQVPIHLPEINTDLLHKILQTEFIKILETYNFEVKNITTKVCQAITPATMRELYSLINKFRFKISMCPDDICPEDLLALTFIEMKSLDLYNWMFNNRFELCKIKSTFIINNEVNNPDNHGFELYRDYISRFTDLNLNDVTLFMYPDLNKSYFEFTNSNERKDRIRSIISCNAYFILNESSIPISNYQINQIMEDSDCGKVLEKMLIDMTINERGHVNTLLDKINERLSELLPLSAGTLAKVLMYDVDNQEFCELIPYGSRQSSSWNKLLNSIFNIMGDELIEQFFINNMNYSNPVATAMAFEYLNNIRNGYEFYESAPMSKECLNKYVAAIQIKLIELAPEFERNNNDGRTRMFFVFLGLADSNIAKVVFNKVFSKDDEIITYLRHNFNENVFFPETVDEIAKYIPEERISAIINLCEGAIKKMLLETIEFNKQNNNH